jgi:class 3 adenylate cyclase
MSTITVLFTDLVGSTALMTMLGPERFDGVLAEHDALVEAAIAAHGGERVKHTGDGVMAVFSGAADGLGAGVAIQQAVERRNRRTDVPFSVRAGLSVGDVTEKDGDYFGPAPVEAARLCAHAQGGQVLAADVVRVLAGARGDHRFVSLGELELKGLAPLATVEVCWEPTADGPRVPLPAALARDDRVGLVGRDAELEQLLAAWNDTRNGERRFVMLSGEPGIGKTRLASELARHAHAEGAVVLLGRCEDGFGAPYKPFAEIVAGAMAADTAELGAWAERHGADVSGISRAVRDHFPQFGQPDIADPDTDRARVCEGVAALLATIADADGVLVVLDDLHWADDASLLLLRHLARAERSVRMLVLGTYREIAPGTPLADTLADVRRATDMIQVPVRGLRDADIDALVAALSTEVPDAALLRVLSSETEGNPFFVREAVAHYEESGEIGASEGVRQLIGQRLGRLSEPTQRMLGTAAVIGREFDVDLLSAVTTDDEDVLLDRLDEARATGLVAERAGLLGRFGFSHALVRATLEDGLGETRRVRLHRRVGEAIETLHAEELDDHLAELAHHFGEASAVAPRNAARYAVLAARQARLAGSYAQARAAGERGLELLDAAADPDDGLRLEALVDLAWVESWAPDPRQAVAPLEEALALALRLGSPEHVAQVVGVVPQLVSFAVATPRLRAALEVATQEVSTSDIAIRAQVFAANAFVSAYSGPNPSDAGAEAQAREALALAIQAGNRHARYMASIALFEALWNGPDAAAARQAADGAFTAAADGGMRVGQEISRWRRARAQLRLGNLADADSLSTSRVENPVYDSSGDVLRAALASADGRWDDAARLADAALARVPGNPAFARTHSEQHIVIRAEQGRTHESLLARVRQQLPDFPAASLEAALAAAEASDRDAAAEMLEPLAVDDFAIVPHNSSRTLVLHFLTDLVALAGTRNAAVALHSQLAPYDGQILVAYKHSSIEGAAARGLGQLETVMGRYDDAEAHFVAAIELEERIGGRALIPRTKYWYARMLLARDGSGDADRAAALLSDVIAETSALGMRALEAQARVLR